MPFLLRQLRTLLIGAFIALCFVPAIVWCISDRLPFQGSVRSGPRIIHFARHDGTVTAVAIPNTHGLQLPDTSYTDLLVIAPTPQFIPLLQQYHSVDIHLLSSALPNHPYIHLPLWIVVLPFASLALTVGTLALRRVFGPHRPPLRAAGVVFSACWPLTLVSASTFALLCISTFFTTSGTFVFARGPLNPDDVFWSSGLSAGVMNFSRKTDPFGLLDAQVLVVLNNRGDNETHPWLPNYVSDPSNPRQTNRTLALPLWIPFLLTALPATLLWRSAYRRHRRPLTNACPHCNYSGVGLPSAAPCPECGTNPHPCASNPP